MGYKWNKMEWVRRYYGVPAQKGKRVKFKGQPGTIVGVSLPYLRIKLDGARYAGNYHPTWEIEYI